MDTETKPLWETTREAMGKRWTVALYPNNTALEDGNFTCDLGQVSHSQQRIVINAKPLMDSRDEALLHELVHVGVRLSSLGMEEKDLATLSQFLYAFLRGFGLWQPFPWPDKEE